jgi:gas vesicle protein
MPEQSSRPNDQGSFLTGFTLGIFAGAVGYYLFATDKGKKLRTQLNQEWQEARTQVGPEVFPYSSLRDVFESLAHKLQIELPARKEKASPRKAKSPSTAKSKFKGV